MYAGNVSEGGGCFPETLSESSGSTSFFSRNCQDSVFSSGSVLKG